MYQVTIKDAAGADVGTVGLDPKQLGEKVRTRLLQEACVRFEANQRVGTHCTKTRKDLISYSNRKPWRQKGTGRARAGTRRSPIWRKGGTIFGPKPRDYSYAMPRKARRRAVQSALLSKFRDNEVIVLDKLALASPKTKEMAKVLKSLGVTASVLIVTPQHDEAIWKSARNIPGVEVSALANLNAYQVLHQKQLLLARETLDSLIATFGEAAKEDGAGEAPAEAAAPAEERKPARAPRRKAGTGDAATEKPAARKPATAQRPAAKKKPKTGEEG